MAIEDQDTKAENKGNKKEKDPHTDGVNADKASHFLVLSDGTHVPYQVGDSPYEPFPAEYDGLRVISVHGR
jgi:hypothetical protein